MTDQVLLDAWERRIAAFAAYNALPFSEKQGEAYTPAEAAQWAIIDEAEEIIRSTTATTPNGIAIQLWTALGHGITDRGDEAATFRQDLAHFDKRDADLDWTDRLLVAALRSVANLT